MALIQSHLSRFENHFAAFIRFSEAISVGLSARKQLNVSNFITRIILILFVVPKVPVATGAARVGAFVSDNDWEYTLHSWEAGLLMN